MNDTGLLLPGLTRSEDRISGDRAKSESSFLPNRRLVVRLVAAAKIRETMRGRTSELGGDASIWTLKYAMAISGPIMALKRTRSR